MSSFFHHQEALSCTLHLYVHCIKDSLWNKYIFTWEEGSVLYSAFLVLFFLHIFLTCEMPYAFSLCALLCFHIDTFFIPSLPAWSFLEQQISLRQSPRFFSDPFPANPLSHMYSSDTAASVNRARWHWMRAPLAGGVYSPLRLKV